MRLAKLSTEVYRYHAAPSSLLYAITLAIELQSDVRFKVRSNAKIQNYIKERSSKIIAKSVILEYAQCSSRQAKLHIFKSLKVLKTKNVRTSEALICLQNQRFGCR